MIGLHLKMQYKGNQNYSVIEPHVKYSLLLISEKIFGDFRVIAFIASVALLITTFFITKEITKKRIPGILAMLLVLQSNIFLSFDTSAAYSNFWVLFYVLSLYLSFKKMAVFIYFIHTVNFFKINFCIVFLPLTIFFVLNNTRREKTNSYVLIFYAVLIIAGLLTK